MDYSKDLLLYQDKSAHGFLLKLIMVATPATLLAVSIYLLSLGNNADGLALLVEVFVIGLIFWAILPHKYQVYEDHVRIVLGGPFSVKIGFGKIKTIGITNRLSLSVNFVTKMSKSHVEIVKKKGLRIAITPKDSEAFVENANRALSDWIKDKRQVNNQIRIDNPRR